MASQQVTVSIGEDEDGDLYRNWEGAILLSSSLIQGGGVAYLRRVFWSTAGDDQGRIFLQLSSSPTGTPTGGGPDFTTAVENYSSAFTFRQESRSIIRGGPNYSGNESRDSSEPYSWNTNSSVGTRQWAQNLVADTAITITIRDGVVQNQSPMAEAGPDQSVAAGAVVTLTAAATSDPDGTIAAFAWVQIAGDTVSLTGDNTSMPTFTAPSTFTAQTLTFELTATDNDGATDTDTVNVLVAALVTTVAANAGNDQNIESGGSTQIGGADTVTNGQGATVISWTRVSGTGGSLSSTSIAQPVFNAPTVNVARTIVWRKTVTNNGVADTDDVSITVDAPANQDPVADAGDDQTVEYGQTVTLDGTGSVDPDGTIATYSWEQMLAGGEQELTLPAPVLAISTDLLWSNTVVQVPSVYLVGGGEGYIGLVYAQTHSFGFELAFTAGGSGQESGPSLTPEFLANGRITISFGGVSIEIDNFSDPTEPYNFSNPGYSVAELSALAAAIGTSAGATLTLDDGGTVAPTVALSDAAASQPTFTAPSEDTDLELQLTVTDDDGATDTDTVRVTVSAPTLATTVTVSAGADRTVPSGMDVLLLGAVSVQNNVGATTYAWTRVSGAGGSLDDTAILQPTFSAPAVTTDRTIVYRITATNNGVSDSDDVSILVTAPVAAPASIIDTQITSSPEALSDTYGLGEVIEVTVTYDTPVDVTGSPQFPANFGQSPTGSPEYFDYAGGTGTTEITFEWTVAATDEDTNGIFFYGTGDAQDRGDIVLNGGAIRNAGTTINADLTTTNRGTQGSHRVDGSLVPLTAPVFSDDAGDAQSWTQGTAIAPITVPEATGNPSPTYAATGVPQG